MDLGGPSVYQGGAKVENKHFSAVFKIASLIFGGGASMSIGPPSLARALIVMLVLHRIEDIYHQTCLKFCHCDTHTY